MGVVFQVDFRSCSKQAAPGDDFRMIFGRTFAGSTFVSMFMLFGAPRIGTLTQNYCTVIKNQVSSSSSKTVSGIDLSWMLVPWCMIAILSAFGALQRFF